MNKRDKVDRWLEGKGGSTLDLRDERSKGIRGAALSRAERGAEQGMKKKKNAWASVWKKRPWTPSRGCGAETGSTPRAESRGVRVLNKEKCQHAKSTRLQRERRRNVALALIVEKSVLVVKRPGVGGAVNTPSTTWENSSPWRGGGVAKWRGRNTRRASFPQLWFKGSDSRLGLIRRGGGGKKGEGPCCSWPTPHVTVWLCRSINRRRERESEADTGRGARATS